MYPKITFLFLSFFLFFSTPSFAENLDCTPEQLARMIQNGLDDETIQKTCKGKSDQTKETETIENTTEPTDTVVKGSPSDWRSKQQHGLGFGFTFSPIPESFVYYDFNLNPMTQIHVQFGSSSLIVPDVYGDEVITFERSTTFVGARRFFSKKRGFYYGLGAGIFSVSLAYDYNLLGTDWEYSRIQYATKGSGMYTRGEIGWQGEENYVFQVSFQPAAIISFDGEFDGSTIPEGGDHRSTTQEVWDAGQELSGISLGFSWFF